MKNLDELGVQELSQKEMMEVEGGYLFGWSWSAFFRGVGYGIGVGAAGAAAYMTA